MKKTFIFLLALALALSLGLMMGTPVAADPGTTYYVSTTGSDDTGDGSWHDPWKTIQHAIGQVVSGDTIEVAPGTYVESPGIVIDKNLSIIGAGSATTTIKPSGDTASNGAMFLVNPDITCHISDVTLDGTGKKIWYALKYKGGGSVTDCVFKNIQYNPSGPDYNGIAICAYGEAYDATIDFDDNVDITGCTFTGIGRVGVLYFGPGITDSTYSGNTYVGKGNGDWLDYALDVGSGPNVTITGSTISDCTGVASSDGSTSCGIMVTDLYKDWCPAYNSTEATITGNNISGSTSGICVGYDDTDLSVATISGNTLENNKYQVDCTVNVDVDLEATLANNTFDRAVVVRGSGIKVPTIFSNIQDAIDAAEAGDTIEVAAGMYVEDLVIPAGKDNLVLTGAGAGTSTIKGVQNVDQGDWPLAKPNIEILADGVEVSGFTIASPDYEALHYTSGMVIGGSDVEIHHNDFEVTLAETLDEISQAIVTYHENAMPAVNVTGLNIHDNDFAGLTTGSTCGYEGIYVNYSVATADVTIADNTFSGEIVRAITIECSDTVISGNTIVTDLDPGLPGGYEGILVADYAGAAQDSVSVMDNTVEGFLEGIRIGKPGQTLTNISVTGNTLQDNETGIRVRSSGGGTVITGNTFTNNDVQLKDESDESDIAAILSSNTFDRAVTVDHPGASLLSTIWSSIQDGVDAAVAGDTVEVAAGTYNEQVEINQSLTLQGAGDTTIIQPSSTIASTLTVKSVPWYGGGWKDMAAIVWVDTSGGTVTVKDLKIDGINITETDKPAAIGSNEWVTGLAYLETSGTVDDVTVEDVYISDGIYRTCGIWSSAITHTSTVEIKYSTVINNNRAGIYGLGAALTVNFNHNTLTGPGTLANQVPNGIFLMTDCTGSATYNTVSQYHYSGVTYYGTGIGTYANDAGSITFSHNTISDVDNAFALSAGTTGVIIENNTVTGCGTGVRLESSGTDNNTIQYNDIKNNTYAIRCASTIGNNNKAHFNNFVGNTGTGMAGYEGAVSLYTGSTYTFDAENNWWGDASGPSGQGPGTGDSVGLNVDYSPWLAAVPGTSPMTWGTDDSIQDAIDAASAGDTIEVLEGTYVEDLVIPAGKDGLELRGAGCNLTTIKGVATVDQIDPPVYNIRFDEFVGVDGVKIHGFTIESPDVPSNYFASGMVLNGQDIEIYDNCFISKGAASAVDNYCVAIQTWRWSAAPDSDITGLKIYNNTFGSEGDLWVYQGVFINRDGEDLGDVTVSGNTFSGNVHMGIACEGNNAVISGNDMTSTYEGVGIAVMDWAKLAQDSIEVSGNDVGGGFAVGIVIGHGDGDQDLTDINIGPSNNVSGNDVGVRVRSSAGGVVVSYNGIHDNTTWGVQNTDTAELDAIANWWGAASGPYHEPLNLGGEGNAVSDNVLFDPWFGDEEMTTLVRPSTYRFDYEVPDVVVACEDTEIPVTFQTDELGDLGYDGIRFKFDATGPGDVTFNATDSEDVEHTFVNSGFWGPETGFDLPANYTATTDWTLHFSEPGEYTITFSLIEAPDGVVIAGIEGSEIVTVRAVDIFDYYRRLHTPYDEVTTLDLLAAADDWIADAVLPGFDGPITTLQLLALADEWFAS